MGAIVTARFQVGSKTGITRQDLDRICDLLRIADPVKSNLPAGDHCRYVLVLESKAKIPQDCPAPTEE
jgi:hypothetical protein